jgi:GAF domain-containing protein
MLISGITTVIHGREEPFGVFCAHSNIHRAFTEDDISFMKAVANVLGGAIERNEAQERLEEVREAERSSIVRDLHDEALQEALHIKCLLHKNR